MLDVSTTDLGDEDSLAPAMDSRVSEDASVMDVPLVDMVVTDVPVVDAPVMDVPLVDMVVTDVPVVDAPVMDVPLVDMVATDVPGVDAPAVDAPPVDAPADCSAVPIGASGGTVSCAGATFTVPPGALTTTVPIRITPTADAPPSGFTGYSRVFRFEPSGTTFATPVRVSIPFTGNPARATLFWSRATGTGYERVGGVVTGGTLTGTVTHFSNGFVGDGVDYSEAPDRSCTATRLIEGRTVSPSGVAMFFSAEDCVGRPLTGLTAADFVVREDGTPLTSESSVTLLSREGPTVFVSLVLDMSSSTRGFLPQLVAACRQFVTTLQVTRALPVQIDVQLFAGESSLTEWQAPTLDTARLLARLDALPDYSPADAAATNLYGAVINALSRHASAQATFRARNAGGAVTSGYTVLFTDGGDTAGLRTQTAAVDAVRASTDRVLAVGLDGGDARPTVLTALATAGVLTSPDTSTLTREFDALANRIAEQRSSAYLLGYCSPRRAGAHTVTVEVSGGTIAATASYGFYADGFGPGCSTATFTCATGVQCGGLGCGACDDRTSACDGASSRCVSHCVTAARCAGSTFTNPRGYSQRCDDQPESTSCGGACRNLRTDTANCGACGVACRPGERCAAGACEACPTSTPVGCADRCTAASELNCGTCGNACPRGASCVSGSCACPPATPLACAGACVASDRNNCGACGQTCPIVCASGGCATVSSISMATSCVCVSLTDGSARCWGYNRDGQVGDGTTTDRWRPTSVLGLSSVVEVSAGWNHQCARLMDGTVRCWGDNSRGQLGDGTTTDRPTPTAVPGLSGVAQIVGGNVHTCARLTDGTVRCWGLNNYGQVGDGTTIDRSAPTPVAGLTGVVELSGGGHTCARLTDGTVRCWGRNDQGQVGDGTTTARLTPVAVPGLANVVEVDVGDVHSCALLMGGTVQCWGSNAWGRLGDGTTTRRLSPTTVPGLSGVAQVSVGSAHTCARLTDGSLRCWGYNPVGEVGDGSTTHQYSPVAVVGLGGLTVVDVEAGQLQTCARLSDRSLRCWGVNGNGSIGDGTTTERHTPTLTLF